ncbi:uncharacterized protein LOC133924553 [Phragmites australis]|uniref:uncharacterized protein LOC133924553 n=1 Tax=Phragmites australis TaxID=29695 RepID=UPI002D772E4D|nr:uncharacterized protein LOC133924553 [Phragmites australis]
MAGGNLFGRALSYVVNELLVEGLANKNDRLIHRTSKGLSCHEVYALDFLLRAFQRFAVKTNRTLENLSSKVKEVREEVSEQFRESRGHDDHFKH